MATATANHTQHHRMRRPRGIGMVMFVAMIPAIFMVAALAIDFSRILTGHKALVQLANEAAQSGAMAYQTGTTNPRLNASKARTYATETFTASKNIVGTLGSAQIVSVTPTNTQVTVTVRGSVKDLLFLDIFTRYMGLGGSGYSGGDYTMTVSRSAGVCLAQSSNQRCTRPDVR